MKPNSLLLLSVLVFSITLLSCKNNTNPSDYSNLEETEPISNLEDVELNDSDGNKYSTIQLGSQVWMAQNLNVSHFNNGDVIPEAKTTEEWEEALNNKTPAYCYYDNSPYNAERYNKLYNWYAVMDSRGLSPEGWHVPTDDEWTELENYLGKAECGYKMKSLNGWAENGDGNNESGFSGLPGGSRRWTGSFRDIGTDAYFWTSSASTGIWVWYRKLSHDENGLYRNMTEKQNGYSVRCILD